jgi:mannose-6-phosphate isomerase
LPVSIEKQTPEVLARDWGAEVIVARTDKYLGKVLHMRAGAKGGLQSHVEKDEAFYLVSGDAIVRSDDGTGRLIETRMGPLETYRIPPGAPHQVEALTDCMFFEVSTPHYDDRVRLEAQYGLPDTGGLPTTR